MATMDMSSMSEQIQAEVQVKQFRDFLVQYNKLSESCFNDCVWDFTSRSIRNNEENCVQNCVEKYTKVTQRISERFQELQMMMNENVLAATQKLGKLPGV
ncbi:mitochondrial import inner membrane translocase subunit Tim9-like [Homarus americanus]|uniref:Mitochondrial import inner membrane translocase subunit Tim9-like n=1 Tax=Homarus americanus TaxID=6706 RepID=A0A8J5JRP8_HOMAM|nr:mitochondrial import inner membrane translocase subunit Tim9-like [Homarus americanus]XP_042236337.1 mitochondrial import inner membrane translocase subunit Tim9-like [Homarus americanus]KAG7160848.1 Mitochondrial import inner membrane translocase subunit Tim9-like [Homarus americanus]